MSLVSLPDRYATAMEYLYRRINYEQTPPVEYRRKRVNLDHMQILLERLGNPQRAVPAIHIAGTKGKGSTAAMVHAMLQAAGYVAGLYTSPHLSSLEERYVAGTERCSPEELVALTELIRPVVTEIDEQILAAGSSQTLTFFEVTTAISWLYFQRKRVDLAVVEVGLGGRLDSTNICHPLVTVITSISFDHTKQLGNTLAAIAREKAGIIKEGVPVISGVRHGEAREVIETVARDRRAPLLVLGEAFDVWKRESLHRTDERASNRFDYRGRVGDRETLLDQVEVALWGQHQMVNAGLSLAVMERLEELEWQVGSDACRVGLREVRCPARIEILQRDPTVIVDTAHNVASACALVDTLNEEFPGARRTLLFAASRDKDVAGMLRVLLPQFDRVVLTQFESNPRALRVADLEETVRALTGTGPLPVRPAEIYVEHCPVAAWSRCADGLRANDLACVTGSFFLAAEMRPLLQREARPPELVVPAAS